MKKTILILLSLCLFLVLPEFVFAHIKWFVAFDVTDPPRSLLTWINKTYVINLFIFSIWGVVIGCALDTYWCKKYGSCNYIRNLFKDYDDIYLNIARIGTGIFFVVLWLVGGVILTPELLTEAWFVPYIQLLIAVSVLSRYTLVVAGGGIIFLYGYSIYTNGLFHLLDYLTLVGLALFLILSSIKVDSKENKIREYRFPILYGTLVFSFLWSSIEKLAFPQWFYPFLAKYPFLTMGLNNDVFIASAAFVEFTLFFLLLMGSNGVLVLALLSNLLITTGNIYFGKVDAIGHFPVNFILLILLIRGPLPMKQWFFDHRCKPYTAIVKVVISFLAALGLLFSLYYGLHWLLYG